MELNSLTVSSSCVVDVTGSFIESSTTFDEKFCPKLRIQKYKNLHKEESGRKPHILKEKIKTKICC